MIRIKTKSVLPSKLLQIEERMMSADDGHGSSGTLPFQDRHEAGRLLARRLLALTLRQPVVLALPRGGVPVGFELARVLRAPLDLVLVRKIGVPGQEELAIGAVADGAAPELVRDERLIHQLGVTQEYLDAATAAGLREIERRRQAYLGDRPSTDITGRTAILVDDGIATGATMLAALRATRRRGPERLVLAVPVAARDALRRLRNEADDTICLHTPAVFHAVGQFYRAFPQLSDTEVTALLRQARAFETGATA
ncbi:MAG TPA: phosphoribosyltransferase [Rhodopila sp.]|uniref:phosphoribosyltransferase n=1 Tax=Rhodopila sp. TaxID=2480087 RepID=UPI002C260F90|nr:phosphoribosyltransferase [Rhodopila sp.]HVY14121.1 phosphoribosyltransferase [Rhodopila sp.]